MREQVIYGQSVLIIILEMLQKVQASLAIENTYKLVLAQDQTKLVNTQVSGLTARTLQDFEHLNRATYLPQGCIDHEKYLPLLHYQHFFVP